MTDHLTSKERVSELISYWESCDPGDETFIREDILRDTIALLKSEGDCTSALGDAYRVFCPKHDTHKARYTDGRPELDDRCPTCVIESLEDRAHGAEVGAAILRDRLERATQPPTAWQPIETAPKGGKWVLLWWPAVTDAPFVGYCVLGEWRAATSGDKWSRCKGPTHWMPLPSPPVTKSEIPAAAQSAANSGQCESRKAAQSGTAAGASVETREGQS